jgi:hypothetical protein
VAKKYQKNRKIFMKNFRQLSEEVTPSSKPEPGREAIGGRFSSASSKRPTKPAPIVTSEENISEIVMPQVKGDLGALDKSSFVKKHGVSKSIAKQRLATEAKDEEEYGYEGDMALNQLKTLVRCAEMIEDMLKPDTDLPEWVQSKITLATDYIQTAADYMYSEMKESKEVGDIPSGDENSPNLSVKKGKTVASGPIQELSTNLLARYKTAAGTSAKSSDASGDYKKGDKRFSGILKATKKQFDNDMKKEEVVQEGRPSQRHPLEGHEYHKKSNDALIHIAKDAHAAAEAMKGHNTDAENKYRDQANDSATVRHFRKTSGMPDWYKKKYGHMNEQKTSTEVPFDGPYTTRPSTVTDKSGAKHTPMSRARDLARLAAKRQAGKMSVKESLEESRKAEIVKEIVKKGKKKEDNSFQAEPELGSTVVKADN